MLVAIVESGVIVKIGDYRDLFPGTSFPVNGPDAAWMQENNCLYVTVWKAHDSRTQKLVPAEPYLENNQVYTVSVADKTQEEKDADTLSQATSVRADRAKRLQDTDWVVIKHLERNENIPGAWEVYRQALRDVPTQAGFPWDVVWPAKPE